jgi:hypothetical protein
MFGCIPVGPHTKPGQLSGGPGRQPPPGSARKRLARVAASLADARVSAAILAAGQLGSWTDLLARANQLSSQARLPYPSRCVTCSTGLRVVGP